MRFGTHTSEVHPRRTLAHRWRCLFATLACAMPLMLVGGATEVGAQDPAVAPAFVDPCADPAAWAAANGARLVQVDPRWNVAFLPFRGPWAIVGTESNDVIVGSWRNDLICGNGGDDLLIGGWGNDTIVGGPGTDQVWAGRGNDTCVDAGEDALTDCATVIDPTPPPPDYPDASITVSATGASPTDARVIPTIDCVRPRSDGLMEAVLGHDTPDGLSSGALLNEIGPDGLPTDYEALPQFFAGGAHRYVFAVPYDPAAPRTLRLEVRDSAFGNTSQWTFDIALGEGPPVCDATVPAVLPVTRNVTLGIEVASQEQFAGQLVNASWRITIAQQDTFCTGAAATPAEPRVVFGFNDQFNLKPIPVAEQIETIEEYVFTANPVRIVDDPRVGGGVVTDPTAPSPEGAAARSLVIADFFARCVDGEGTTIESPHPGYVNHETLQRANSFTNSSQNLEVFWDTLGPSGFRRFR